jgi:23S rRNA (uracil1939-C5)-methyltransferase
MLIELELTQLAPTGEAIGRHEGKVVFVPYTLPGERVEVELEHQRRSYARARLLRVVHPARERVTPPCPYFGRCGGCQWQHMTYAAQLAAKTRGVQEQFTRIGKFEAVTVQPCMGSPRDYGYRNHIQYVLSPRGHVGYYRSQSNAVIEIDHCAIADPVLNELVRGEGNEGKNVLAAIQREFMTSNGRDILELHLRAGVNTDEYAVIVEGRDHHMRLLAGHAPLHEQVGAHRYAVSAPAFFQVNTGAAALLVEQVMQALALQGTERVLDLYCGVGLFTVPMSTQAAYVLGVEANPAAAEDARANLSAYPNARIINATLEAALRGPALSGQTWDAIVVDPPRAGLQYSDMTALLTFGAPRLVYVSCDAATLARDARRLVDAGYRLGNVQPIDLFPQTHHVETVATFARPAASS